MIEVIKKILNKLIGNVDKYHVTGHFFKYINDRDEYHFSWEDSIEKYYWIKIIENNIKLSSMHGFSVDDIKLDDDNKYEVLDLCQKLKKSCEEYTKDQFIAFADSDDTEPDNIDA